MGTVRVGNRAPKVRRRTKATKDPQGPQQEVGRDSCLGDRLWSWKAEGRDLDQGHRDLCRRRLAGGNIVA